MFIELMNMILKTEFYPTEWETVRVILLYKEERREDP
jgi:hypothetical protein